MPDVVDAAQQGVVVLLATIVAILLLAVGSLFGLVIKILLGRVQREEELTDKANAALDKAVNGFQVALDLLGKRRR